MRKGFLGAAAVVVVLSLGGCVSSAERNATASYAVVGVAELVNSAGQRVGTAELRQRGSAWSLALGVSGQTPGEHGMHLHEVGQCKGPDFASAKGHLNPVGKGHGSQNPGGMHMGDLPNLTVSADGTASTIIAIPNSLDPAVLMDADGTALVIHAGPDDYKTDPAGNSGPRVACGAFVSQ